MLVLDDRQRLLAKKQELEQIIKNKMDMIAIPMQEWNDELSSYDQHPGDQASDLFEREKEMGMLEMLEFELEKVNDALIRNAMGQGHICSICGQEIEPRRLERLVNTTVCSHCAHIYDGVYQVNYETTPQPAAIPDLEESFPGSSYEVFQD